MAISNWIQNMCNSVEASPRLRGWMAAGVLAAALPVAAAPLSYVESVSGDLPESSGFPVLMLGAGNNTVSGSQFFSAIGGVSGDFDSFRFVVPTGMHLVSVKYAAQMTGTVGTLPSLYVDTFIDDVPVTKALAHEKVNVLDPSQPLADSFALGLPLGAGQYLLYEGQLGGIFNNQSANWNYTWTLAVENDVPEPASMALVLPALGTLAWVRRRSVRRAVAGQATSQAVTPA